MSAPEAANPLATLLDLQSRARGCASSQELGFVAVNETQQLTSYRQSTLWTTASDIVALSGIALAEANSPYVQWLAVLSAHLGTTAGGRVDITAIPAALRTDWNEWLPEHAIWLPWRHNGQVFGGLLLARDTPWNDAELLLLGHLSDAYAHAWRLLHKPSPWTSWKQLVPKVPRLRLVAAAALLACIPVRLTVLAPAEIVALHPDVVRSPLEGVVEAVNVEPNANVRQGDLLFTLDRTALESRRSVAESSLAATQAELRQTTLLAVSDTKSQARLAVLAGQIDEQQTELDFVNDLLARSQVRATRTGVALFDDASEWIGKPVALGERVMSIADAHDTEIEAWLSVADAIELPKDASVTVYLNATPLAPVRATLRLLGYEPQMRPEGVMAYRVRATLQRDVRAPRVGLKGTAKIAGARVPLVYWIFRRPIAAVRQFLGW